MQDRIMLKRIEKSVKLPYDLFLFNFKPEFNKDVETFLNMSWSCADSVLYLEYPILLVWEEHIHTPPTQVKGSLFMYTRARNEYKKHYINCGKVGCKINNNCTLNQAYSGYLKLVKDKLSSLDLYQLKLSFTL